MSYFDKLFVIIIFCFTISYFFYYIIELNSIRLGKAICKRIDHIKSNLNESSNLKASNLDGNKIKENNLGLNEIYVSK